MKRFHSTFRLALLAMVLGFCLAPVRGFAQDITLAWDASTSPDVAGYKIYYEADSSELPMEGIEALEGPSPVDVGDVTTFTMTGLPEGHVYYFRATAYDSTGNESTLSNLAASAWIPSPLLPESDSTTGSPAMLVWSSPPTGLDLTFTVLYGTDAALPVSGTTAASGNDAGQPPLSNLLAALACLLGMALRQQMSAKGRKRLTGLAICVGLTLATVSCGGGGGGGGGDGGSSSSTTLSSQSDTVMVSGLTENYLTTDNLESGTTYYWKVVAVDGDGQEYESGTSSFIAE
jgi:hypothetical protein